MEWEAVIGLEVHVQLKTNSKLFSGAAACFGADFNTEACIIDLAMPGVLPVLNEKAVKLAVKFGLSVDAEIAKTSVFARKNYFYPDLPKGYQISQYDLPIVKNGYLDIYVDDVAKKINITRAHLEEDTGKSFHENLHGLTGLDFNRAGVTLLEIVSGPDLRTGKEVVAYLKALHTLVRYIDISDANMQEGSFRCDANVSVRPKGQIEFGTRAEVKNINSFRYVEKAIDYEIKRQIKILEDGGKVVQETRLYDSVHDETRSMRSKEEAEDYRYFPDPDLLPLVLSDEYISDIQKTLSELPQAKFKRLQNQYGLNPYEANILVTTRELADYFEETVKHTCMSNASAKLVANWILGDLSALLNENNLFITESPIKPKHLASLLNKIADNTISGKIAKDVFVLMWKGEGSADEIIVKHGLQQIADTSELEKIIAKVIAENPIQYNDYKSGKEKLFGFFVGKVMQATQGKANPALVNQLLKSIIH